MSEQWKRCHPDYEVSDQGRVRRTTAAQGTSIGYVLTPFLQTSGYWMVILRHHNERRPVTVHKLVATAFLGPRPRGQEVNHKDGDKANNKVANLEYCTRSYNNRHAYWHGRRIVVPHVKGSAHGLSKLTEDKVREIKRLKRDENMTGRERAKRFGVNTSVISEIDNNKAWTHVILD